MENISINLYCIDLFIVIKKLQKIGVKLQKRGAASDDLELGIYYQGRGPE